MARVRFFVRFPSATALLLGVAAALGGCDKKDEAEQTTADAGVDGGKVTALDPELAQAMAQASVGAPGAKAPQGEGAPPPNGILSAAAADKEAPRGSAPKLALASEGSDPKVSLGSGQLAAGSKLNGTMQVVVQQGQQGGGLPIEFAIGLEAQKPKEGEAPAGSIKMRATVAGARIPVAGAGTEIEGAVGKLKGARIEYLVAPGGAGSGYKVEPPKTMPADLGTWLEALRDTIALVTLPVPDKAVGTGAYWMVTSREAVLGMEVVSYRLVKVEAVKDGIATLSVNTKRYATSAKLELPGLPPDAPREMSHFESPSEARLEYKPGSGFPLGGDATSALIVGLGAAPGPKQRGQQQGLMVQSRAVLSFGGAGAAAKPARAAAPAAAPGAAP